MYLGEDLRGSRSLQEKILMNLEIKMPWEKDIVGVRGKINLRAKVRLGLWSELEFINGSVDGCGYG